MDFFNNMHYALVINEIDTFCSINHRFILSIRFKMQVTIIFMNGPELIKSKIRNVDDALSD